MVMHIDIVFHILIILIIQEFLSKIYISIDESLQVATVQALYLIWILE